MSIPAMTCIVAIVQPEDSSALLSALTDCGCGATHISARGGFLNRHAVAVLALVPANQIWLVLNAARATCSRRVALVTPVAEAEFGYVPDPIKVEIGGAVIFGLAASAFQRWGIEPPAPTRAPGAANATRSIAPGVIATTVSEPEEAPVLDTEPTKLLVAIVPDRVANRVVAALVERRFGATRIGSTGGFLRRGNTTILTGVPADQADEAATLIATTCQQAAEGDQASTGIAFALDVDWRLRL